jgi:hypothetical protein
MKMEPSVRSSTAVPGRRSLADGVYWNAIGAVSLGANSHMVGNLEAAAAITVGAGATCNDLKAGGAITLGAGAECRNLDASGAVTLAAGAVGSGSIYSVGPN